MREAHSRGESINRTRRTNPPKPATHMPDSASKISQLPPAIRLQHVSHAFGAVEVVRDVSLEIPAGSFTALVGPSGCGKTTILRLIGGLERLARNSDDTPDTPDIPTRGGTTGSALTHASDATMGFAFQEPRLLPWRSVLENVALPLELQGESLSVRRARALEALERMQLADAAGRFPHQLSGGMKMRAAIARALVSRPRVLLLDEPFGALDEVTRHELDLALRTLWESERFTAVLVTHSIPEAAFLAERIVVLSPRPAAIVAEIATPSGPRDLHTWTRDDLGACVRTASDALLAAIAERRTR